MMSYSIDPLTGLPAWEKQPNESIVIPFDFTALLGEATVSSVTATSTNMGKVTGSSNLGTLAPVESSGVVEVRLAGGTNREVYKITLVVTDSDSNVYEDDIILRVNDR